MAARTQQLGAREGTAALDAPLKAMLDALPSIAFVTDAQGETVYANARYQTYTGLSAEALGGTGWASIVHPEDQERTRTSWAEAQRRGEPVDVEYRLRGADGLYRWFQGRSAPQRDADGGIRQWLGTCTDVHDLKLAEAEAREAERWLRLAQEASGVGTFDWMPLTRELRWSDECKAVFGLPPDARVDDDVFMARVHPEDRAALLESTARALDAGGPGHFHHRYRALWPGGTVRWVEARGRAIFEDAADGRRTARFTGTVLDITEARRTEMALRESEAHLAAMFEQATVGICETDLQGRFLRANMRYLQIVGRPREELLTLRMQDVTHPEDLPGNEPMFQRTAESGQPFEVIKRYVRPDGSPVWVHNNVTAIRTAEGGVGVLCITVDLTERRRAEAALRDSEDHYRHTVELSPQISWTAGPGGLLEHISPRWRELTGISGLGAGWTKAIHPEDAPLSREAWDQAIATGEPYDVEHRVRLTDGRYCWMHTRGYPRRDAEGRVVQWYGTTEDIEVRKAAESALSAQAEELRAVLDAVPAGIWITHDPEAREIIGNARSHEFLRVPQGENQSKGAPGAPTGHFRFLDTEGREVAPRDLPVQTAARGEPVAGREYRVAFDDGSHIDLLGNATPLRDAAGRPAGAVAAFVDITARKAAEAALLEESQILETLNRAGLALAGELDLERLVQSLTDAGVKLTGAKFGAFFHNVPDDSGERLHLYTLSGARRSDFEGMGGVRATGVFGPTFRNEGVVRADDILTDPRYGRMGPHHGMPPGHLPVRSYLGVPVVAHSGEVLGGLLFGHPEPRRFADRHEQLMVGLAAQAAIAIDNARLFQAVQSANETLEHRVAERSAQLLEAQEALQQSQKMEAIGQLTGGIAHDFNNLLTPIVGGLDILRRRVADERSQRLIGGALQAAERAATLVQRLLAFARRQTLQPRAVHLADLIEGMRELIDRSLGPTIEVRVEAPADLPPVLVDPNQLELALLNLSVNARDAMPDGGRLTISAEATAEGRPPPPGLPPGRYMRIAVADTGAGMEESVLQRAVEPFFSTKGLGKGTGLGLSMVHGLAAQSGGLFALASRVGQGTTATLWLPVADAEAAPDRPAEAVAPRAPRPALVLLVDDEALVRLSTAEELRDLGYEVIEAGTAAEALEILRAGVTPDALVTDHMMPGMSGAQLAAELRTRLPSLPVLMITGYANLPPEQTRGLAVLAKPFRQADLAALLARMLTAGGARPLRASGSGS